MRPATPPPAATFTASAPPRKPARARDHDALVIGGALALLALAASTALLVTQAIRIERALRAS